MTRRLYLAVLLLAGVARGAAAQQSGAIANLITSLVSQCGQASLGASGVGAATQDPSGLVCIQPPNSDSLATGVGGKSVADSVVLPASTGWRQYITHIRVTEYDTLAVTGSAAADTLTSSNLASFQDRYGNAIALGATNVYDYLFPFPMAAKAAGTATKLRVSPGGAGAYWIINVWYYYGP